MKSGMMTKAAMMRHTSTSRGRGPSIRQVPSSSFELTGIPIAPHRRTQRVEASISARLSRCSDRLRFVPGVTY